MKITDKLLVFDWGGIIVPNSSCSGSTSHDIGRRVLLKMKPDLKFQPGMFNSIINYPGYSDRYVKSFPATKTLLICVFSVCDIPVTMKNIGTFVRLFNEELETFTYFKENVEVIRKLHKRVKTALLSDVDYLHLNHLYHTASPDAFDYLQLSCDAGVTKFEPDAFFMMQKITGVEPKDILFFDDNTDKLEVAKLLGWNVVRLSNPTAQQLFEPSIQFIGGSAS